MESHVEDTKEVPIPVLEMQEPPQPVVSDEAKDIPQPVVIKPKVNRPKGKSCKRFRYTALNFSHDLSKLQSHHHLVKHLQGAELPSEFSVVKDLPDPLPYDQGSLGSCTSNAIASALILQQVFGKIIKGVASFEPSRLFIYWRERSIEHDTNEDAGAAPADGLKSCVEKGVCHEKVWPYEVSKFTICPPHEAYHDAYEHRVKAYGALQQNPGEDIVGECKKLLNAGRPIVFGMEVYSSFEEPHVEDTGVVPVPDVEKETWLGGHCMCIIGYSDKRQAMLVLNSWSSHWGCDVPDASYPKRGCCWIPYKLIADQSLCDGFLWFEK